jgi:hypothetical protein
MASRHEKGRSGSNPIDPVGGAKENKLTVKLGDFEAWAVLLLSQKKGISRGELIRALVKTAVEADPELHEKVIAALKGLR